MASHGMNVSRSLRLLLASLAALMLSACAPRRNSRHAFLSSLFLPAQHAPDSCEQLNCGAHAACVQDRGDASCVCNAGFAMTPTGCVDTCVLKNCGANGKCVRTPAGVASCVCATGFVLQPDGVTCTEAIGCEGVVCTYDGADYGQMANCEISPVTGKPFCVCDFWMNEYMARDMNCVVTSPPP
ncbi:unnamed protein product [Closterium sp. Yama58-4]|nr:unnamed protein product [Closterium sp. Yama58-4]